MNEELNSRLALLRAKTHPGMYVGYVQPPSKLVWSAGQILSTTLMLLFGLLAAIIFGVLSQHLPWLAVTGIGLVILTVCTVAGWLFGRMKFPVLLRDFEMAQLPADSLRGGQAPADFLLNQAEGSKDAFEQIKRAIRKAG